MKKLVMPMVLAGVIVGAGFWSYHRLVAVPRTRLEAPKPATASNSKNEPMVVSTTVEFNLKQKH